MAKDRNGVEVVVGSKVVGFFSANFIEGVVVEVKEEGNWFDTVTVYVEEGDRYFYCDVEDMEVRDCFDFYLEVING